MNKRISSHENDSARAVKLGEIVFDSPSVSEHDVRYWRRCERSGVAHGRRLPERGYRIRFGWNENDFERTGVAPIQKLSFGRSWSFILVEKAEFSSTMIVKLTIVIGQTTGNVWKRNAIMGARCRFVHP
jgi:hypothetical protein